MWFLLGKPCTVLVVESPFKICQSVIVFEFHWKKGNFSAASVTLNNTTKIDVLTQKFIHIYSYNFCKCLEIPPCHAGLIPERDYKRSPF